MEESLELELKDPTKRKQKVINRIEKGKKT